MLCYHAADGAARAEKDGKLKQPIFCLLFSISRRRHPSMFFKLADIMFCGIISDCFRNICHSHSCIRQEILGAFDSDSTDHFCIGHSHQIFNQMRSVFIGIMKTLCHSRKCYISVIILDILNNRITLHIDLAVEKRHLHRFRVISYQ